jgi:hypothetical protein
MTKATPTPLPPRYTPGAIVAGVSGVRDEVAPQQLPELLPLVLGKARSEVQRLATLRRYLQLVDALLKLTAIKESSGCPPV